jgi:GTP-binding protein
MYAATNEASLPGDDESIPEVAFAGRSNVGKSSLINAVTLSSAARSSDVPGKTQSLNFYDVSRRLRVVDMPGYGFAFANDDVVTDWNRLMDRYLTGRKSLKRVYVVVDARHGLKKPDREMLAFLSKYGGVSYAVVLNKTDLVKPADLARRAFLIKEELRAAKRARAEVWMASTSTGAGVAEFGAELLSLAAECAPGEGGKVDRAAASAAAAAAAAAAGDDAAVFDAPLKKGKARELDFGGYEDDDEPSGGVVGGEWIPGQPSAPRRGGRGGEGEGGGEGEDGSAGERGVR